MTTASARAKANAPPPEVMAEAYRRMVRIRLFEERLTVLLRRGEIYGAAHTSIGQEAGVVGALMAVKPDDYMTGTHRSHGHPIGKGSDVGPLMAELMAKATGVCRGRGGSMHLADFSVGSLGESGIVASAMPVAVGAGLSAKLLKTGRVCVCFFGDGASNEGAFHESLNLAAAWDLPVIFVCENNGYAITTSARSAMRIEDVAVRAAGYGMPGVTVDGQDFIAVYDAVAEAAARARAGQGPSLVEAKTYRFDEHALGLSLKYRQDDEIARWRMRDPIAILGVAMIELGHADEAQLTAWREGEAARIEAAVQFGRDSPTPEPDDAFTDVYANPFPIRFDDRFVGGPR
jgi:pyruvate dehydrogenase E1 component alpha subunit